MYLIWSENLDPALEPLCILSGQKTWILLWNPYVSYLVRKRKAGLHGGTLRCFLILHGIYWISFRDGLHSILVMYY